MHLITFNGKTMAVESFEDKCFINQIQLEYYLNSAIVSLDNIRTMIPELIQKYEKETYYYRAQIDNILYCCGCIHDVMSHSKRDNIPDLYNYSRDSYPNISNRAGRNLIMHLFERNKKIIEADESAGGFNVIKKHDSEKDKTVRQRNRRHYAYTLDLQDMKILFHDMQRDNANEDSSNPDYEIDLNTLGKELFELKQQAELVRESFMDTDGSKFKIQNEE